MRKLFSFIAIAAVALGMVSCGDEPEQADFQFEIQAMSDQVHVVVKAQNTEAFFLSNMETKSEIEAAGGIQKFVEEFVKSAEFDVFRKYNIIAQGSDGYTSEVYAEREYVAYACYVEKGEDGFAKIIGNIAFKEFKTMPEHVLPGEFTVNAQGKKVHFADGNLYMKSEQPYSYNAPNHWSSLGRITPDPHDLFTWTELTPFGFLSADEWWYIFKGRDRADELFAHAILIVLDAEIYGLLILPDNWQTPEGVTLKTAKDMNLTWREDDDEEYRAESISDCFEENIFKYNREWPDLEFAGAVFLPAAGVNGTKWNSEGWYWAKSENAEQTGGAYAFSFDKTSLILTYLKGEGISKNNNYLAVRIAGVLE